MSEMPGGADASGAEEEREWEDVSVRVHGRNDDVITGATLAARLSQGKLTNDLPVIIGPFTNQISAEQTHVDVHLSNGKKIAGNMLVVAVTGESGDEYVYELKPDPDSNSTFQVP